MIGEFLSDPPTATRMFFQFCLNIREINDLLYATGRKNVILDAYMQIMGTKDCQDDIQGYYRSYITAYTVFGLMDAWILRGYRETPENWSSLSGRDNEKIDGSWQFTV